MIQNSLKFSPGNGSLISILISYDKNEEKLHAIVIDNGKGIKPSEIPKLFTRFTKLE